MLIGTLFKAGSELRLEVQIEDVTSGRIIAARSRQGADLFAIVDGLAGDIRSALDVSNGTPARPLREVTTTSFEAVEATAMSGVPLRSKSATAIPATPVGVAT